MAADDNLDRNFSFNLNVSGIAAPTGSKDLDVPEGFYKALISDCYINPEKNRGRVILKLNISEGTFRGVVRTDGLSVPKGADDKVRYYWRGLLESAGYTAAQLDNGEIVIGPDTCKGREVTIHYSPKGPNGNGTDYDKVTYLPAADWAQQKQVFEAKKGTGSGGSTPNGSALGSAVETPVQTNNTVSKNDVMAKLGLR